MEEKMGERKYDLEERLLDYAVLIVKVVELLPNTLAGRHIAGQLIRSGTSALPNHGEAEGAESRNDFVHKLSICYKELHESYRWLRLIQRVPLIQDSGLLHTCISETDELRRIFVTSIRTARSNVCREEPEEYVVNLDNREQR
jgi:four helix bundle protein